MDRMRWFSLWLPDRLMVMRVNWISALRTGGVALGLFCVVSCAVDKPLFKTFDLTDPITEIDMFSDSTYFSQVSYLVENEGDIYLSDSKRGQVFRLGADDLKLKKTIGNPGRGPQDIVRCSTFGISHDTLMVYDFMGDRMQMYNKNTGAYIGSINWLKKNLGVNTGSRAPFVNGRLIFCSMRPGGAVMSIDVKDTARHKVFGDKYKFDSRTKDVMMNYQNILENNRYIVTVSEYVPIVKKYDKNGKQIDQYDLSQVEIVKRVLDRNASKPVQPNVFWAFATDAYLYENKLYVLINNWEGAERPEPAFQIVELDVSSRIKPTKVYKLPAGEPYSSIAADGKYLYTATNKNCLIQKFKK